MRHMSAACQAAVPALVRPQSWLVWLLLALACAQLPLPRGLWDPTPMPLLPVWMVRLLPSQSGAPVQQRWFAPFPAFCSLQMLAFSPAPPCQP